MSNAITTDTCATIERLVTDEYCTTRGNYQIFSTPDLVLLVEATAIKALEPLLAPGQDSVGSHIAISHVGPSLKGQTLTSTTRVSLVDRRRVVFDVEVRDDAEVVSTGSHERFIIDLDKFDSRLAAKAESLT